MTHPISRDEFETVKELLSSAAKYAESANDRLDHASMTIGDNALSITRLEHLLEQLAEKNTAEIATLTQFVTQGAAEAAADRALIRDAIEAMLRIYANRGGQT